VAIPTLRLPSGEPIPVLGQGTWHLGEDPAAQRREIAALRRGVDRGITLIDTAEMYGDGASERLVGRAIAPRRDDVFLVSKVLPSHATRRGVAAACAGSLERLGTDHLDLYLLHWRGSVPLRETLLGFADLQQAGAIRHWGVSNFELRDMAELVTLPGGQAAATDQVLLNPLHRGVEYDLLPWCRSRGIPVLAYSPFEQGELLVHPAILAIAERHAATAAQIALAWLLDHPGVAAVARASDPDHVDENRGALDIRLTARDVAQLTEAFPPPHAPQPLEMI
jgi:diketogulonate reductase-like aldo/keto reductase